MIVVPTCEGKPTLAGRGRVVHAHVREVMTSRFGGVTSVYGTGVWHSTLEGEVQEAVHTMYSYVSLAKSRRIEEVQAVLVTLAEYVKTLLGEEAVLTAIEMVHDVTFT